MRISSSYLLSGRILILILFISFLSGNLFSQNYTIRGKVIDVHTKEPLAFVNILADANRYVAQTDIDGLFKIDSYTPVDSLRLSYLGYEPITHIIDPNAESIVIEMRQRKVLLNEVIILPGENLAHRIINKMIENREINDPEKLEAFSYSSYNKMIFSADVDSVRNDTLAADSDYIRTVDFFDRQYLFLMESVTQRKFQYPDKSSEKLIASKISGFKDPFFALMMTQMQSFSFYKDWIEIGDKKYLTPVSKGSTDQYFFLIEDTLYQGSDSIFVISFTPHKNKNFDALKGVLYINTNGFAIQNAIAEPANEEEGGLSIKVQQKYDFIENKHWFPVQLNSDFIFKNVSLNKIKLIGQGRSYLMNIDLNPEISKNDFSNIELEVEDAAVNMNDTIWKIYRTDSLTAKDKRTYHVIDSIGKKVNFDRTMKTMEALISGKIPVKIFDLDLNRILDFNDYEGFRLGLGMHTNYKISKRFSVGGYVGYGFQDKAFKYGYDGEVFLSARHDARFGASYAKDVEESGGIEFFEQNPFLSDDSFRDFMVNRMDSIERKEIHVKFSALRYLKANLSLSKFHKSVTTDYYFESAGENISSLVNQFDFTEFAFKACYSYKEKFIKTTHYKISTGTKYPILYFNYIKGFNDFLDGEFSYQRFDIKLKKSFYLKRLGNSTFQLQGGWIDGDLPFCNLYSGIASYHQFTIAAPGSFTTMRMNEFFSDRYAAVFYTHSFGKLLFRAEKFSPEIAVATNYCIGDLKNVSKHYNVEIKKLNRGYIESGFLINNIVSTGFYGLGAGAYYRYGAYAWPAVKDNLAFKFTFTLTI